MTEQELNSRLSDLQSINHQRQVMYSRLNWLDTMFPEADADLQDQLTAIKLTARLRIERTSAEIGAIEDALSHIAKSA